MRGFGWMRLAGLFLILTILAALVRMGGGVEARSLATHVRDTMSDTPAPMRYTEDLLSDLEDMRGGPPDDLANGPLSDTGSPVGTAGGTLGEDAPAAGVFYRPSGGASRVVCGDLQDDVKGARVVFPLERRFSYAFENTWGAVRPQGGHEGTDLMAPRGVPEYAMTDGVVVPVAGSNAGGWNRLGGHAVMIRASHSIGPVREGDFFYYAHLERRSPLEVGDRVRAGQPVGRAGDTGQGPPGTRGLFPPHLHLGWYDGAGGREQATSGAMNPYPLLEWIRSNGGAVSGGSDARFCEIPRSGPPAPSAHDGAWPDSPDPDLDAGPKRMVRAGGPGRGDRSEEDRHEIRRPDRPEENSQRPQKARPGDDREPPSRPERPAREPQKPGPPGEPEEPQRPDRDQYDRATGGQADP